MDITRVESMQWNRTLAKVALDVPRDEVTGQDMSISKETLEKVREAIAAEVELVEI